MDKISEVIDMRSEFRILRRPYDEDFARSHGITMAIITNQEFIPCLNCGSDIMARILMHPGKGGRDIVYCGADCRKRHSLLRMIKLNEATNIRETAKQLVAGCMAIEMTINPSDIKKRVTPLVIRKLLAENNRLAELNLDTLNKILMELRNAHRST